MTKKHVRSLMIGFCVFLLVIIIMYTISSVMHKMSVEEVTESFAQAEQSVSAEDEPADETAASAEYFLARYNGENIVIYACAGERQEFMYTLDARIEDISEDELEELAKGIFLPNKEALALFEEDFTS